MTSVLEPSALTGRPDSPVRRAPDPPKNAPDALEAAFARAHAAADALMAAIASAGSSPEHLDGPQLDRMLRHARALANRHERIRNRSLEVVRAAREAGCATHDDDGQFAARRLRTYGAETARQARLAQELGNEQPTAAPTTVPGAGPATPASTAGQAVPEATPPRPTARAWDTGEISERHAHVICQALDQLPEALGTAERGRVEEELVRWASQMSPDSLRRKARRALALVEPDRDTVDQHHDGIVRAEEEAAWQAAELWLRDRGDGTVQGQFVLPVLQGRMLAKALDALVTPRRLARRANGGALGAPGSSWKDTQIDWAHEKGKAFAELIDHLPTDHLASKVNAVLLVHTDLETLRGETDRVGVTDSGDELSAGEVRRLASNAGIIPVVMGRESQPLDLGRQTRNFSDSQRAALATRYEQCAEEDCNRPFSWCEIHHAAPWAPVRGPDGRVLHPGGGRTDLRNAIPLCGRHHRRLMDPQVTHRVDRDEQGRAVVRFERRRDWSRW